MTLGIDTNQLAFNYQMQLYYPIHALMQKVSIRYAYFILMLELQQLLSFERVDYLYLKNYYSTMEKSLQFQGFLALIMYLFKLFLCLLFELILLGKSKHLVYFQFYLDLGRSKSYFLLSLLIQGHGMFCSRIILINSIMSSMLVILFLI